MRRGAVAAAVARHAPHRFFVSYHAVDESAEKTTMPTMPSP